MGCNSSKSGTPSPNITPPVANAVDKGPPLPDAPVPVADITPSLDSLKFTLIDGCKTGDLSSVREVLSSHPLLVNVRAMWDTTPLIACCRYNSRECARYILGVEGVDERAKDEKGGR